MCLWIFCILFTDQVFADDNLFSEVCVLSLTGYCFVSMTYSPFGVVIHSWWRQSQWIAKDSEHQWQYVTTHGWCLLTRSSLFLLWEYGKTNKNIQNRVVWIRWTRWQLFHWRTKYIELPNYPIFLHVCGYTDYNLVVLKTFSLLVNHSLPLFRCIPECGETHCHSETQAKSWNKVSSQRTKNTSIWHKKHQIQSIIFSFHIQVTA